MNKFAKDDKNILKQMKLIEMFKKIFIKIVNLPNYNIVEALKLSSEQ